MCPVRCCIRTQASGHLMAISSAWERLNSLAALPLFHEKELLIEQRHVTAPTA